MQFKDQLADYENVRLEVEKLKTANSELTKLAAENAKRMVG